jgi:SAM-dependent methyltransferase
MSAEPTNIYEAEGNKLAEERERLSTFDLPNKISIEAIGTIKASTTVLDVGAGPNTGLLAYVVSESGVYTALDKNADFLEKQKDAGATILKGDARNIPIADESFDITHARFVISHLGAEKQKAIREVVRVTKTQGSAIFLDYDWSTAHGSDKFEKVKNFMINGGFLFDADFGAELEDEVRGSSVLGNVHVTNYPPTPMTDYSQILKLREAGTTDLRMQGKDTKAKDWNDILDEFQKEADSDNPPGFYFPGIVVVSLTKD